MTAIDYTEKGKQIATLSLKGLYGEPPDLPPVGYVRIVGLDASKLTGAQAKQIADGYKQVIGPYKAASKLQIAKRNV